MTKATGTYASLVRGVSQQAPADRLEGQHGEQINMLSDPVRGLVRRNGSLIEHQLLSTITGPVGQATADSFSFRTFTFQADGRELDLMYRSRPRVAGGANYLDGLIVYDKTLDTHAGFVDLVTDPDDTVMAAYLDGGFSAITAIGSYVLMAGNTVYPTDGSVSQLTGQAWSNSGAAWIRGGAYARTYTLKVRRASDSTDFTVTYTTKAAMYPGTLDTTGIAYTDLDYQKQVNDLTYAYNTAVNQWINEASEDIVPSSIAQNLIDLLTAAGFTGWTRNGSHIGSDNVALIEVSDGGDGSLFVSLLNSTNAADEVTEMHYIGKVVKVQPKTANDEVYYLKAYAKDGLAASTGLRPVIWRESAGVIQTPVRLFAIGVLHEGTFYAASNQTLLEALVLAETTDVIDVPPLIPSAVGDLESNARPAFMGKPITAMAIFQDRLMIASGSTLNLSRPGDYFNFYRSTVVSVVDDDPIEVYALGTETDTIRQAATFDKALVLYGDQYHYMMSGRTVQTPSTASIAAYLAVDNTAGAKPLSTGTYVFSLKEDNQLGACRLMQTKVGVFQDRPQFSDVSRQLRDYINGTPAEMIALSGPNMVFVRTEHFLHSQGAYPRARPAGLYVYQYMDDDQDSRLTDSWSAWEWSMALGTPIGMSAMASGGGIMVYTLAWGRNQLGQNTRAILAMSFSARPDPTGMPYLDGMRKAELAALTGLLTAGAMPEVQDVTYTAAGAAYSNTMPAISDATRFTELEHPHYTMGDRPADEVDPYRWTGVQGNRSDYVAAYPDGNTGDLWTGTYMPAWVDITSPFVRDRQGKAKTRGRLTLVQLLVTLIRSAGFNAKFIDRVSTKQSTHFGGAFERINYDVPVWVGRDSREVQVRLAAETWLPITINKIEWSGQWFESK